MPCVRNRTDESPALMKSARRDSIRLIIGYVYMYTKFYDV